jgi:succinate dehydrogenase / fumarate reductase cytochrome b subunit
VATSTVSAGKSARSSVSTIIAKVIVAVTGIVFVAYVVAHMYGNLMILGGKDAFNDYAHHLRVLGEPMLPYGGFLWVMRVVLIASLIGHAGAAVWLWRRAGRARSTRYVARRPLSYGTFYARAMRWGGVALLLFVVFHLLHLTTNTIKINGDYKLPADRLVSSFEVWWAVLVYLLAVLALGMHLLHGIWGAGMTLGLNTSLRAAEWIRLTAIVVATVAVVGFMVPPLAILFGLAP